MLPLSHPVPPEFDVSFPEKLLKIVATRGNIFSLKFTKYRLAAGLCPDPLEMASLDSNSKRARMASGINIIDRAVARILF